MPRMKQTPGNVLSALLKKYGLNYNRLAKAIGLSSAMIRLIARDENPISAPVAFRLAKFFRTKPEFWLLLQLDFDCSQAAEDKKLAKALAAITTVDKATFERKPRTTKAAAQKKAKPAKKAKAVKAKTAVKAKAAAKAKPAPKGLLSKAAASKKAAKKAAPKNTVKTGKRGRPAAKAAAVKVAKVKAAPKAAPAKAAAKKAAPKKATLQKKTVKKTAVKKNAAIVTVQPEAKPAEIQPMSPPPPPPIYYPEVQINEPEI